MSSNATQAQCRAVHELIRAVELNTKTSYERGKSNPKKERAAVKKLLALMNNGKAPTEADIDLAMTQIWPALHS